MATGSSPRRHPGNRLLAAIPEPERRWLEGRSALRTLTVGDVLYRQGQHIDRLYFPESGLVSLTIVMPDGKSAEVGTVGPDGAIGVHVLFGIETMPCEVQVQAEGSARVVRLRDVSEDGHEGGRLPALMCRYAHGMLVQAMQIAACNKLHSVQQRAARWILAMHDGTGRDTFPLTQETLATMLGARRQSVNEAAASLKRAHAIDYRHGVVTNRDSRHLERLACECHSAVRRALSQALDAEGHSTCPCCGTTVDEMSPTGQIA